VRIVDIFIYSGRNIYSHYPVMKVILDLKEYAAHTTDQLPLFTDRLLSLIPTLHSHHCSRGEPGGFAQRLQEGTYLGHVVEHIILELQTLAGFSVIYGKTRSTEDLAIYEIVVEYQAAVAAKEAARQAVKVVNALLAGRTPPELSAVIKRLQSLAARFELGPSSQALVQAARERDLPVLTLDDNSLVQIGYGANGRRIEAALTSLTSCLAVDIAKDKSRTKKILRRAALSVPEGRLVLTEQEAVGAFHVLGGPVALKPEAGNQGKGVSLNLTTVAEVRAAFTLASNFDRRVLVEKYISGCHLRALVVNGEVVAVAERLPAHVVGDGLHNLRQLIDITNADGRRGDGHEKELTKITVDPVVLMVLARCGLTFDYVPAAGEIVFLRENANLSTGGTARDVTGQIGEGIAQVAERAARAVGLDVAGVDLVVPDFAAPAFEVTVIEVNAAPGLRMHIYPSEGAPQPVARAIIDYLFPVDSRGRIPLVSVTGTNGKTTTVRLIAHILAGSGLKVGFTCTDGVYIGNDCVWSGDNAGYRGARFLLEDPTVEAAVLETARGGLIRDGLAYDWADVGVITNISEDHLGQYGIDTVEDLAKVKSLVIEAISPHGYAVLSADDPTVASLASQVRSPVIYFSTQTPSPLVQQHVKQGGRALYVEDGVIVAQEGKHRRRVIKVARVPITLHGRARHNLANALAAMAAAWGLGVPVNLVRRGLLSFYPNLNTNPGRANLFMAGEVQVLVDYGHNVASYHSTLELARALCTRRLVGVIGVPGDRPDDLIERVGQAAAGFDYIYIKEDEERRGRAAGEVADLLLKGVRSAKVTTDKVRVILREDDALRAALADSQRGDLVVVFYEKLERVLKVVDQTAQGSSKPFQQKASG
jgi:cyanophycin synthetase